jgi:hypothetical protein
MAEPYPADNPRTWRAPQLSRLTGAHAVSENRTIHDMIIYGRPDQASAARRLS